MTSIVVQDILLYRSSLSGCKAAASYHLLLEYHVSFAAVIGVGLVLLVRYESLVCLYRCVGSTRSLVPGRCSASVRAGSLPVYGIQAHWNVLDFALLGAVRSLMR